MHFKSEINTGVEMTQEINMPQKPDWQIIGIYPGFVIEANCNGGGYRRVYSDGKVVYE
jgi:hypothetical protein